MALLTCAFRATATPAPVIALGWDPSGDPTVIGYNVYYGASSRNYTNILAVGSATSAMVSNLVAGVTYYFAATTYTVDGLESDYSTEASYGIAPPNNPPTLDLLPDRIIQQDAGVQVVPLTGITSGAANENQTLNVSAFSNNPGLVANPQVAYITPDTNGTLTFSPTPGSFGSAIITVMVDDGAAISNTVIRSFMVTVNPVDNPPTIDLLNDLVIMENAGLQTVNFSGITSGSTNKTSTLSVTAVSSNPALIPTPAINYASPTATGTLTFSPVTNAFGLAKITVIVRDDQPTNNQTSVSFNVTVNQNTPIPGLLTNAIVAPNTTFRFLINPPIVNGDKLNISLATGAPAGAKVVTRKGLSWLVWTPTTAQASTTNLIGIRIIDSLNASLSTNETLQVIVQDYLALAVGTTSIQAGQNGTVSLALSSSEGVTNLSFSMPWPANSLPNPTLSISAAGVASSSLSNQANNVVVTIQMAPGQVLQGSNIIGSLSFQSVSSQPSGYINLPIGSLTAAKPSSALYANAIPTAGQVALVNGLMMLQANGTSNSGRNLTVLAKVGNTYQVQYCTNLGSGAVWYPLATYTQTNISQNITLDPTMGQVLYRIQQR